MTDSIDTFMDKRDITLHRDTVTVAMLSLSYLLAEHGCGCFRCNQAREVRDGLEAELKRPWEAR